MTTRKGRGVSSLTTLTERKEENRKEKEEKLSPNNRLINNFKEGKLTAIHQRICEIIFSSIPEGKTGIINVDTYYKDENITPLTFRKVLKCLNILGYIEILPTTRLGDLKGTTIKVKKAYEISPLPEKAMSVYNGLRSLCSVKDGKETKITLIELSLICGISLRQAVIKNIHQLALRRYIKDLEIDETSDTVKFCFTSLKPKFYEEQAITQEENDTAEDQKIDTREEKCNVS